MNYSIIKDKEELENFIYWLPEETETETYYLCLFARKKYAQYSNLSSDKGQLKRFTSKRKDIFDKIKQLECEVGSYKHKNEPVPEESLVLYITVNPRSMLVATKNSLIEFAKIVSSGKILYNPHQEVLSQIQKSCSRKIYVDFDFDIDHNEDKFGVITAISQSVNKECITLLETRGGIHCLVETAKIHKEFSKTWYQSITSIKGCDIKGDNLIPVPGCCQGGFIPGFINI